MKRYREEKIIKVKNLFGYVFIVLIGMAFMHTDNFLGLVTFLAYCVIAWKVTCPFYPALIEQKGDRKK